MTLPTSQLADAITAVGTRPEGFRPCPLRASTSLASGPFSCAQTLPPELHRVVAHVGYPNAVAARVSFLAEGARARHGMPSLPAGCEVCAGHATYPDNSIEDGTPAGSSNTKGTA